MDNLGNQKAVNKLKEIQKKKQQKLAEKIVKDNKNG